MTAVLAAGLLVLAWSPGLAPDRWWPALALLAVAGVWATVRSPPARPRGALGVALVAAAGWAMWSTLSVGWAQDRGWAVEAAGRSWLVAVALGAAVLWPPRRPASGLAAAGICAAAVLVAAVGWWEVLAGGRPPGGRLRGQVPYANGFALLQAAGALAAAGLALGAASRLRRGAAAGLVVVLLGSALAAQSRSVPAAALAGGLVLLALAPVRRVDVRAGLAVAAGLAIGAVPVLAVRRAVLEGNDVASAAGLALAALGAGALLAALVAARADAASPCLPDRRRHRLACAAALVVALVPIGVSLGSRPDYDRVEQASTRFVSGGSNRPDMWRVAARTAAAHPVGVGAGSFARPYLRLRRSDVAPRFAHALPAEAAATLGLIGLALVVVLAGALLAAAAGRRIRSAQAAGLGAVVAAVLAHALVDWTTELPVIALLLALAVVPAASTAAPTGVVARPARKLPAAVALAVALLLAPAALAAGLVRRADHAATAGARTADLRTATRLGWPSARPSQALALAELDAGRPDEARAAAATALERAPSDWFALWLAGALDPADGERLLRRAAAANPREPLARSGRPADVAGAARVAVLGR